jgi:hypothetical protein
MPSNAQINQTLTNVLGQSLIDERALSPNGRRLIEDVGDTLKMSQTTVREKNADDLFHSFVWYTRNVDVDRAKKDPDAHTLVHGENINSDVKGRE